MFTILLIDDDQDDRFLFEKALQKTNQPVEYLQAESCNAALSLMKDDANPDIIFLDINMPEENGYTCLEILQNNTRWSHVPIIIYTTSGRTPDVERALASAHGYLKKPYDVQTLSGKLLSIINDFNKT